MFLLKDRIQAAFNQLPTEKQNQRMLADHCGVRPPSVNDWFSGATKSLKGKSLIRAAEYLNVDEMWLATGKGSMERTGSPHSNVSASSIGERRVPLLNYVQAGMFADCGQNFTMEEVEYLLTDLDLSERAFALQIKGNSMLPDFKEGDRIIVDCEVSPRPGDYVVAKNSEEEATFKKYRLLSIGATGAEVFELTPLNTDYPSIRSDQQQIHIIGTMIEHRKYYRRS